MMTTLSIDTIGTAISTEIGGIVPQTPPLTVSELLLPEQQQFQQLNATCGGLGELLSDNAALGEALQSIIKDMDTTAVTPVVDTVPKSAPAVNTQPAGEISASKDPAPLSADASPISKPNDGDRARTTISSKPVIVVATPSAPVTITPTEAVPITPTEAVPVVVAATPSAPVTITPTEAVPVVVAATPSAPVAITPTEAVPVVVATTPSAPVAVTPTEAVSVVVAPTPSAPVTITPTEAVPVGGITASVPLVEHPAEEVPFSHQAEVTDLPQQPKKNIMSAPAQDATSTTVTESTETVVLHATPMISPPVSDNTVILTQPEITPVQAVSRIAPIDAPTLFLAAAEAVAAAVTVSPALMRGEAGEIRVQLKPDILEGAEVVVAVDGKKMDVTFVPTVTHVADTIISNQPLMQQQLAAKISNFEISVTVAQTVATNVATVVGSARTAQTATTRLRRFDERA